MRTAGILLAVLLPLQLRGQDRARRVGLDVEAGAVWQSRNDVEIPNDGSASRFSLVDVVGTGPWPAARVYLTWHPGERHALRLLAAPLSVSGTGAAASPLRFAGATYAAAPLRATYTFNSYRVIYRYRLRADERRAVWIGLTGKIRDATIALEQGAVTSRKDDLGFVPLLHFSGEWQPHPTWRLGLDADAIAGGPGRAEDAAVTIGRDLGRGWSVQTGYRLVEGGADVPDVYTFAWLHYAVVSIKWKL